MAKTESQPIEAPPLDGTQVVIAGLTDDEADEVVVIENRGTVAQPLTGWVLASLRGPHFYEFPEGLILHPDSAVRIHSGPGARAQPPSDLVWRQERMWRNRGDTAVLFGANGHEVARWGEGEQQVSSSGAKLLFREDGGMQIEDAGPRKYVTK